MASLRFTTGKLIPLLVLAVCVLDSAAGNPERRVSSQDAFSQTPTIPKSSTFTNNELTSEPRRKISHRLMGGHVRVETKTESRTIVPKNYDDEEQRSSTFSISSSRSEKNQKKNEDVDDEDDVATWDDGLILSSAGNGKENKKSNSRVEVDDDEKKTLSQQVKEGKYGLIQNEIYPEKAKRPGIISYLSNPEVPKDTAKNLGGLDEEEIWLAENHVLVLRGGNFPDHDASETPSLGSRDDWSPIDDYKAPNRQVKIPRKPKVPPPFPVQLTENGPVQIIGVNGTSVDDSASDYENDSGFEKGFLPGEGPFFASTRNGTSGSVADQTSQENTTKESSVKDGRAKSGRVPPPSGVIGPFYPALPPGAVFVVPPGNQSDYDEDDQSIYYPPPYSFTYKQDNSTPVPPGPLVPGIILPPPPDFFSGVEEKKSTTKMQRAKYPKRPSTTPLPRATPTYYPPRKSSAKPHKGVSGSGGAATKQASQSTFTMKPINRMKFKTTTERSTLKPIRVPETLQPNFEVTTPGANRLSTLEISEFYTARPSTPARQIAAKATTTTTRTKSRWSENVSSKPVPLVSYFASSTPSSIDEPVEATPASVKNIITTRKQPTTRNQASYYFYEESSDESPGTTANPTIYYRATTEAPFYRLEELDQRGGQPKKSYYDVRPTTSQETPKDYGLELLEPVSKTSSRYHFRNSGSTTNGVVSARVQGQRMLASPLYYETATDVPPAERFYPTTKQPREENRFEYEPAIKPKPIYQYSFEAAEYSKRNGQSAQAAFYKPETQQQSYYKQDSRQPNEPADYSKRGQAEQNSYYKPESQRQSYYKQDTEQPTERPEVFDEWQEIREENQRENQNYDYESGETLPEQQIQPERETPRYRNPLPIVAYPSSTARPFGDVTPNPNHAYYTKQDEQLLDDVTKEYFTNFGKKIRGGGGLPSTTPIYGKTRVTERPDYATDNSYVSEDYDDNGRASYKTPRVNVHYGDQPTQRPYSLEGDTQVNYKDPLPPVNVDSEWIPGFNPKERVNVQLANYRTQQTQLENQDFVQQNLAGQRLTPIRGFGGQRIVQPLNGATRNFVPISDPRNENPRNYPTRPVSLAGDIAVNYRNPRPPINPDAEFIDTGVANGADGGERKASYFAYRLPGDGGHFYFLTPQAISQRQDAGNGGYLYPRPRETRLSRQRRRGAGNA